MERTIVCYVTVTMESIKEMKFDVLSFTCCAVQCFKCFKSWARHTQPSRAYGGHFSDENI